MSSVIQTVYLETSVIGYLASRMSGDLITAANQRSTREWWDNCRGEYRLCVSAAVIAECTEGDPGAAKERMAFLRDVEVVDITESSEALAAAILTGVPLPDRAQIDALHIAVAAVHRVDFLLTWNCKHIANATFVEPIRRICSDAGQSSPILCTPQQLMKD